MAAFETRIERIHHAKLDLAIRRHQEVLAAGKIETFESYRYHVGVIQGLREAERLFAESIKEMNE